MTIHAFRSQWDCASAYRSQSQEYGYAGNVSFRGTYFSSYGTSIANYIKPGVLLISSQYYSSTTSGHKSLIGRSGRTFYVPSINGDHDKNVKHYLSEMKDTVMQFSNTLWSGRGILNHNNYMMSNLKNYCKEFVLKMPLTLGLYLDPEYPFVKNRFYKSMFLPQWLATKGMDNVESKDIFKVRNADIRREIILKVGIERLCYDLKAKVIEKIGDYELIELDLRDGRRRPFLKMHNPSVPELWHVEGVHPCIKTVQDALNYRRYGNEMLELLPELDWREQNKLFKDWKDRAEWQEKMRQQVLNPENVKIKEEFQTSQLFPNPNDWKPSQLT